MTGKSAGRRPGASDVYKRTNGGTSGRAVTVDPTNARNHSDAAHTMQGGVDPANPKARGAAVSTDALMLNDMFNGHTKQEQRDLQERRAREKDAEKQRAAQVREEKAARLAAVRAAESRAPINTGVMDEDLDKAASDEEEDIPDEWDA